MKVRIRLKVGARIGMIVGVVVVLIGCRSGGVKANDGERRFLLALEPELELKLKFNLNREWEMSREEIGMRRGVVLKEAGCWKSYSRWGPRGGFRLDEWK